MQTGGSNGRSPGITKLTVRLYIKYNILELYVYIYVYIFSHDPDRRNIF